MIVKGVDALPVEHRREAEAHLIGLARQHDRLGARDGVSATGRGAEYHGLLV